MTQKRAPDLRRLLALAMDGDPARHPAQALEVTRAHRLPISVTAEALGLTQDPLWSAAVAEERARAEVRAGTLALLAEALGPIRSAVAVEGLPWRPLLGTDVDLLVPERLFADVTARLTGAGLVEVGRHAGPGRTALARIGPDGAVDLVDVEVVPEDSLAPPPPRRDLHTRSFWDPITTECADLGAVRPGATRDRLCRAVAARGVVRLRDLADAEVLELFSTPAPAGSAARGFEMLRTAVWDGVRAPEPARPRGVAARAALVLRVPGAFVQRHSVRVLCTGPGGDRRAAELAADLRALAIDVILLERPGRGAWLRAVLRGAVDDAVVVSSGRALFPRPTVTADPATDRAALLRQVLRQLSSGA